MNTKPFSPARLFLQAFLFFFLLLVILMLITPAPLSVDLQRLGFLGPQP